MDRREIEAAFGVTGDQLDAWAREYEEDAWEGRLGEASPGRPRAYDEDMETVTFRLPVSRIRAVESVSNRLGETKSDFFRKAIDKALLETA